MAIVDWEAARRRDEYGPEPADAIPECNRNCSSPKALTAWGAMSDEKKRTDFADAAELDAYLWDKLSQTSNSRTVVYAKDLASS